MNFSETRTSQAWRNNQIVHAVYDQIPMRGADRTYSGIFIGRVVTPTYWYLYRLLKKGFRNDL